MLQQILINFQNPYDIIYRPAVRYKQYYVLQSPFNRVIHNLSLILTAVMKIDPSHKCNNLFTILRIIIVFNNNFFTITIIHKYKTKIAKGRNM